MIPTTAETRLPRILVVDDMPDNLFLMNGLFEDHYEVVQAGSGREALEVVMSRNPPDIVLLDIMMPDMDGYEVMRRMRQYTPAARIPIIFLTALASRKDERLGLDMGAIDYLTKPVDPEQVMARVQKHVQATSHARLVEALSEKMARHLPAVTWQQLFNVPHTPAIGFEHQQQTILFADCAAGLDERDKEHLGAEIEWLVKRYGGRADRFHDGAAVGFFADPAACVRMAMELQRTASDLHLRIGVHTGPCDIATFRIEGKVHATLVGRESALAAEVAATAASGSIAVSPATYALVKDDICADATGCLLMEEFHDSDLAQVSLTPAPLHGMDAASTFAGLGQLGPGRF